MLVSIGIGVVDRFAYFKEAVQAALAQTWPHIEILVGDDGDSSAVREWCLRLAEQDGRLKYHYNGGRLGIAGNWNAIAARAEGEFIVFPGDDDRLLPRFVERLVTVATSDTALVFSNHHIIDARGRRLPEETDHVTRRYHRSQLPAGQVSASACAWGLAICPSAALVRRRHVLQLGFGADLTSPDIDLFIRLASDRARFDFVPELLVEVRQHPLSLTTAGLRHDTLLTRLLDVPVAPDLEPLKRDLLAHLAVTAVSRSLERGDCVAARRVLQSGYYPMASRRASYMTHQACAVLPGSVGAAVYRTILQMKRAVGRSRSGNGDAVKAPCT
jgi:glycosyltransferase involved in cell wall biosynthesis